VKNRASLVGNALVREVAVGVTLECRVDPSNEFADVAPVL
jgi:hypothetical protein